MLSVKNEVTLSYRQGSFSRLNSINERIMAEMIAQKKFRALMPSNIVKIEDKAVTPERALRRNAICAWSVWCRSLWAGRHDASSVPPNRGRSIGPKRRTGDGYRPWEFSAQTLHYWRSGWAWPWRRQHHQRFQFCVASRAPCAPTLSEAAVAPRNGFAPSSALLAFCNRRRPLTAFRFLALVGVSSGDPAHGAVSVSCDSLLIAKKKRVLQGVSYGRVSK